MSVDLDGFPQTLYELKTACEMSGSVRKLWARFEGFFSAHGLTLWVDCDTPRPGYVVPPDDRHRAPDGFAYRYPGDPDAALSFLNAVRPGS